MTSKSYQGIIIKGARTNNLKDISLEIPHNQLIVVTGISGSGKSSLAFEIIAKEGQRRYFETLPSFARQFLGKLNRPDVDEIEGLSPVIAIQQYTAGSNARSTVGTMTDIYDFLRLLFARTGETKRNVKPSRALFSFNSSIGKCERCNGIGKEEQIDLNLLVNSPEKSIREGALAPTLPNGYITYSQVTIDVLNQVCEAEGFNVDIPWNDLTAAQQAVVLYGSDKIKVPFGKHSLESRLKWTGIKAKPREEGFYKGMIPIMSDILKRDRNPNILKFVHAVTCPSCHGTRLNEDALSVLVNGKNIADVSSMELIDLKKWLQLHEWEEVGIGISEKIIAQIELLEDLGLGHLNLNRQANTLHSSEIQRIRVANQILVPLSDVLYVFDEPSIGLHPEENARLIHHFKRLVQKGNTVIVVEHDLDTIRSADHIIEMGPKAGKNGGELIFNGLLVDFLKSKELANNSPTYRALTQKNFKVTMSSSKSIQSIRLKGCHERNLKNIDVEFQLGKVNIVSGKSGSGKSSLVKATLLRIVQQHLGQTQNETIKVEQCAQVEAINKLIFIDHSPIGKTPRSNPATYLGISDHIRDLFARLPQSKEAGFTKSRFSFNNKGGRCETCQGAGKTQIGMHFLGNIDLVCETCNGERFNTETLAIKYKGISIADCYKMTVNDAFDFFESEKKIAHGLKILQEIGLGYLTLGQSSTTLSGGEAQRIKIANQLQKKDTGKTLYIIIEPSIGLHQDNIESLLQLFDRIKQKGNTIVCIEQDESIINNADWHIELGPAGGRSGGKLMYQGVPDKHLKKRTKIIENDEVDSIVRNEILLNGVSTNGLKNINVRIPKKQLTVVTGLSGSGKSSLVYDTLFSTSNSKFTESLSTYNRSFLKQNNEAEITSFSGLGPAIAVNRKGGGASKRSTVGTLSGVYDALRLLYSRIAQEEGKFYSAQHFSFNHHLGACSNCEGLGIQLKCDPEELIAAADKSVLDGALRSNKIMKYYADINGQYIATLKEVAHQNNWDLNKPWNDLSATVKNAILYGTGGELYRVNWEYKTKTRTGSQELQVAWLGFCNYIDNEYQRTLHNKNTKAITELLNEKQCESCHGSRLKDELLAIKFLGKNIFELTNLEIADTYKLLCSSKFNKSKVLEALTDVVLPSVLNSLQTIIDLGLGYLNLNRSVRSLSGGERQRVTLAGQLSNHLFGVTYIFDEPTIGLDQKQVAVLLKSLRQIVKNGNTVVVVEHDPGFIRSADYLIELGPGAGPEGGAIMFQGSIKEVDKAKETVTYKLFTTENQRKLASSNKKGKPFGIKGAMANNLKDIDITFYAGQMIAVTGVSGSGKSSLVKDVLYRSWEKKRPIDCKAIQGLEQFDSVQLINQEALPENRLGTPVSYTRLLDQLKEFFSKTTIAKEKGLKKADFSYQSKKGKCLKCGGYGRLKTSMDFMSDIWLTCDSCKGKRYNEDVLACTVNGRSIGDVLEMTVKEAISFFKTGT